MLVAVARTCREPEPRLLRGLERRQPAFAVLGPGDRRERGIRILVSQDRIRDLELECQPCQLSNLVVWSMLRRRQVTA